MEDTQARAEIKMRRAVEEVKKLLVPAVSTHCTQADMYTLCTLPFACRMDAWMDAPVAACGLMRDLMFSI